MTVDLSLQERENCMGSVTDKRLSAMTCATGDGSRSLFRLFSYWLRAIALHSLLACTAQDPQTLVMVEVASELQVGEELTAVVVTLMSPDGEAGPPRSHRFELVAADGTKTGLAFPFSFLVKQGRLPVVRLRVSGEGMVAGADTPQERIAVTQDIAFIEGKTKRVQVLFARACVDVVCADGQTCYHDAAQRAGGGECGPIGAGAMTESGDAGMPITTVQAPVQTQCSERFDDCDDGLFCNGEERCDPDHPAADPRGCLVGEAPACPDNQRCVEEIAGCAAKVTVCALAEDCDDGQFCNGEERCAPEDPDADAVGCRPGIEVECGPGQVCDEQQRACSTCESDSDGDNDGFDAIACGGDDCADHAAMVYPGRDESCDGVDNDCDGMSDEDADVTCAAPSAGSAACVAGQCIAVCPDDFVLSKDGGSCERHDDCAGGDACGSRGRCIDGAFAFQCGCALGERVLPDGGGCRTPQFSSEHPLTDSPFYRLQDLSVAAGPEGVAALWAGTAEAGGSASLFGRLLQGDGGWGDVAAVENWPQGSPPGSAERVAALWRPGRGAGAWFVADGRVLDTVLTLTSGFSAVHEHSHEPHAMASPLQLVANRAGEALVAFPVVSAGGETQMRIESRANDGQLRSDYLLPNMDPSTVHLGIDAAGRALVVRQQYYWTEEGAGWIARGESGNLRVPVVLGESGAGIGGQSQLSHFQFGRGWTAPEPVAPAVTPQQGQVAGAAMDRDGNVLVAWAVGSEVFVRAFDVSKASWAATARLPSHGKEVVADLQIAMSPAGEALLLYRADHGKAAWVHRFVPGQGGSEPHSLSVEAPNQVVMLRAALDAQGDGLLVYLTFSAAQRYTLWAVTLR